MVYDGNGFEVEFIQGETIVVTTLTKDQIRPIASGEIANARKVA
jgi:ABC-type phosphate transport system substrate-binding protein